MTTARLAISLPPELAKAVRRSAGRGTTVSAWIADAIAMKLRNEALRRATDEWQRETGIVFTDEELARTRALWAERGIHRKPKARRRTHRARA